MRLDIYSGDTSLLKKLGAEINKAVSNTINRLADYGAKEAQTGFDSSFHTGSMDITVHSTHGDKQSTVEANGEQVCFTEFGTGVMYADHPLGAELGMTHGSYGQGKGANPKGWTYRGEPGNWASPVYKKGKDGSVALVDGVYHTRGQPASRSMFNASEAMKTQAQNIFEQEISKL